MSEYRWKLLSQLWNGLKTSVGAIYFRIVFDLYFVDFLWTTFMENLKRKENKLTNKDKIKHTSGKNL